MYGFIVIEIKNNAKNKIIYCVYRYQSLEIPDFNPYFWPADYSPFSSIDYLHVV